MSDIMCARPDYEAECKKLSDENLRLRDSNEHLKRKLSEAETECKRLVVTVDRLKAQLDIVYLIFKSGR